MSLNFSIPDKPSLVLSTSECILIYVHSLTSNGLKRMKKKQKMQYRSVCYLKCKQTADSYMVFQGNGTNRLPLFVANLQFGQPLAIYQQNLWHSLKYKKIFVKLILLFIKVIFICIPLLWNYKITGFAGLFEYDCALSQNRSNKIYKNSRSPKPSNLVIH